MWSWFQYAATGVEIAVNVETGQIRVIRAANACDSGNPVSPKIIEGQLEGALHMAIGFCVTEETLYNENGEVKNACFGDYRLPLTHQMPKNADVFSLICPDPLPDGPYGAKGMSESVVSAVGPAIASALYRAAGIRLRSYPMTAEKVLEALELKKGG
jgi:carbon-monoxide dehydrogenase large subunit